MNPWTDDYHIPCNGPLDPNQPLPGLEVPAGSVRNWVFVPRNGPWSLPPAGPQESSAKPAPTPPPAPTSIISGVPDWLLFVGGVWALWFLNKR